jgi:hypothetical protein
MAEQHVLSFKPTARLEQVGEKHSEHIKDRKHRRRGCDDSALSCESRPDGIFGKDTWLKIKNPKAPAATRAIDGTF